MEGAREVNVGGLVSVEWNEYAQGVSPTTSVYQSKLVPLHVILPWAATVRDQLSRAKIDAFSTERIMAEVKC